MENKDIAKMVSSRTPQHERRNKFMIENYQRKDEGGEYVMEIKEIYFKYDIHPSRLYAILRSYKVPTRQTALKNK